MKARIHITLKPGVHDPQGRAIGNALAALGFDGVDDVRQGKYLEIGLTENDRAAAQAAAEEMCAKLLANPMIENYTVELKD